MDIAVVGLGNMGRATADRLLEQGHAVTVYNRSAAAAEPYRARGVRVAADLAGVWEHAPAVITFLADDAAVESVLAGPGGLIEHAPAGGLLVEMSTISAAASARVAAVAAERGVRYLRAPVSGNPTVVTAGRLSIMVSGDRDAFDAADELLHAIGPTVAYVGPTEQARLLKLAINAMIAGIMQMLAEAIVLGEAGGLDRADMLPVIAGSAVGAPLVGYKSGPLAARDYTTTFSTELLCKDLGLALDAAADEGVRMPTAELVLERARAACELGLGQHDFLALLPALQQLSGQPTDVEVDAGR